MQEANETQKPNLHTNRGTLKDNNGPGRPDGRQYESLLSIEQSLLLLTGGCQAIERTGGHYCERHRRRIPTGETRCGYVAEHYSHLGGAEQKARMQQYVNDLLGIKDLRTVRRLIG